MAPSTTQNPTQVPSQLPISELFKYWFKVPCADVFTGSLTLGLSVGPPGPSHPGHGRLRFQRHREEACVSKDNVSNRGSVLMLQLIEDWIRIGIAEDQRHSLISSNVSDECRTKANEARALRAPDTGVHDPCRCRRQ